MGLVRGGRLLSAGYMSGFQNSTPEASRWAETRHTESLLRKFALDLEKHLIWTDQPRENAAADALPRWSPSVSIPGVQVLP